MVKTLMLVMVIMLTGCANLDYQFGDISQMYCNSISDEFRAEIKAKLTEQGLTIGVDYCAVHGLVDRVVNND